MWNWLDTPATPRPGESLDDAERRITWVNRVVKASFAWDYVIPAALVVVVAVVLLVRSLL